MVRSLDYCSYTVKNYWRLKRKKKKKEVTKSAPSLRNGGLAVGKRMSWRGQGPSQSIPGLLTEPRPVISYG